MLSFSTYHLSCYCSALSLYLPTGALDICDLGRFRSRSVDGHFGVGLMSTSLLAAELLNCRWHDENDYFKHCKML